MASVPAGAQSEFDVGDMNVDLDDPELLAAMEIFAGMSPEELEETMTELMGIIGDDPEALSAMQEIIKEIPNMMAEEVHSSLEQMVADDEVAKAMQVGLELLYNNNWETIWEKRDLILDAVIQSGEISVEQAATFKSDKEAWEKELKFIWGELQIESAAQQAAGNDL
eukprot:scaffold128339_cov47-Attheya_sp.AAC.3